MLYIMYRGELLNLIDKKQLKISRKLEVRSLWQNSLQYLKNNAYVSISLIP